MRPHGPVIATWDAWPDHKEQTVTKNFLTAAMMLTNRCICSYVKLIDPSDYEYLFMHIKFCIRFSHTLIFICLL